MLSGEHSPLPSHDPSSSQVPELQRWRWRPQFRHGSSRVVPSWSAVQSQLAASQRPQTPIVHVWTPPSVSQPSARHGRTAVAPSVGSRSSQSTSAGYASSSASMNPEAHCLSTQISPPPHAGVHPPASASTPPPSPWEASAAPVPACPPEPSSEVQPKLPANSASKRKDRARSMARIRKPAPKLFGSLYRRKQRSQLNLKVRGGWQRGCRPRKALPRRKPVARNPGGRHRRPRPRRGCAPRVHEIRLRRGSGG